MFDLTTLGEGQIRLTVPHGERLQSAGHLRVSAACAEANVAGLLAQLKRSTSWGSILPEGDLAERCLAEFRAVGVDTSAIVRVPEGRTALYFMEPGEGPMPSYVTYDRLGTPFRDITADQLDWERLLNTRLVLLTGITAALTSRTAAVVQEFAERAHRRGVGLVLDVNYRSLLWSPSRAREVLQPIAERARILFCSRRDAITVFGVSREEPAANVPCMLRQRFGVESVVTTDRTSGVYVSGPEGDHALEVDVVPVIDRPGAGDALAAGALDGYLDGSLIDGVKTGMRLARTALTHYGDLTRIGLQDLRLPDSADIIR